MEDGHITRARSEEINLRQKDIVGDYSDRIALVVGLGGIGNWIALQAALLGIGTLVLFDDDKVENSNLNRTLFKLSHVGEFKTQAVKQLIHERRSDIIVVTNEEQFKAEDMSKFKGIDYFFDCTDSTRLKNGLAEQFQTLFKTPKSKQTDSGENDNLPAPPRYAKLGYDGFNATMCVDDFTTGKWGDDSSYTITPSFFGTPSIISSLAIIEMVIKTKRISGTVNMNVRKILNRLKETPDSLN